MAATISTPHSQPSFNAVSYEPPTHHELHKFHTDSSSSQSHTSSPESRPVDLRSPIPEEDEETSSEAANEPLTPTDSHHPPTFTEKMNGAANHNMGAVKEKPPLILNTAATPPPSAGKQDATPGPQSATPKTPVQKRPTLSTKDSGIKKAVSGLFRRSNSHNTNLPMAQMDCSSLSNANNGSDPVLGKEHRRQSIRRMSATTSPYSTRSNTPPSPGSPTHTGKPRVHLEVQDPSADQLFHNRKKNRSSTGLSIRDRFSKHKITFQANEKDSKHSTSRHRSTSVDLDTSAQHLNLNNPHVQEIHRQVWGMAADSGIGLKSRRLSLNLPDDFMIDVIELYSEYTDQSKLVGRRGKTVGKGATANVRLMNRKGGSPGEVYAVKEFRGKSSNEKEEEYEKKVKSEYSIAKSVHHPNIVETFRLCSHSGRWNHVMEFCEQGDLFSLVAQKYLREPDHQVDRLCLFKQLIQGLNYLHNNGIAHRDVKLENLLITKDSKLKITDFGVSEVFAGIHPGLRSAGGQCGKEMGEIRLCDPGMCGSPPYVAPEVIEKKGKYDPRPLDVWGAAIVMICMTAGGNLWNEAKAGNKTYDSLVVGWEKWNEKHSDDKSAVITDTDYPHVKFFDDHISPPALRRVLLTMLNPDPKRRVTMAGVATNRWLKNVECCQIDSYDDPTIVIDASKARTCKKTTKVVHHNHLPPTMHLGHRLVRLPGSTDM